MMLTQQALCLHVSQSNDWYSLCKFYLAGSEHMLVLNPGDIAAMQLLTMPISVLVRGTSRRHGASEVFGAEVLF